MEIKAFHELKQLGKTPVVAKIGGFLPDPTAHSWFAGHFFIHPDQGWPADQDGVMIPILQIYLPEVPGGLNEFNECKMNLSQPESTSDGYHKKRRRLEAH
ncbi:hypothetical protein [Bacillus pumilus]|uniref:hypothetical protein n=1 Tax=Bacillus pumilus TaxID=1408 RepID=UPI001EE115BF|nr:hypothetical protein [Bacillus pumilus]MED1111006.1 hypothetical protein [Bacillus pumilus]